MKNQPAPDSLHPAPASPFPDDVAFVSAGPEDSARYTLLPGERALLSERAAERRVREFTLGRGCAREALAALDPALGGIPILRIEGRLPRWPEGIVGAITHHKGAAAAAAVWRTRYQGLGLDLEALRPLSEAMRARLLRPEERERLQGRPGGEANREAMVIFSAKESIYKCLQPITGIFLGFQDAEVFEVEPPRDDAPAALGWRLLKDCPPRFPAGSQGVGAYRISGGTAGGGTAGSGTVGSGPTGGGAVLTGVWVAAMEE